MTSTSPVRFESLDLIEPLLQALHAEGYTTPTPIQRQAIPHVLQERDLLGCAQTGTGKTAAFALPILQILSKRPSTQGSRRKIRTLVLTPTRELAAQIEESFVRYGANLGLTTTVIFGGVGQGAQVSALRKGIDILVATPGRLLDLIDQRLVSLDGLEIFVLDEADRMLDMGFIHDVKKLLKIIPKQRQSLFFSATMPPDIQRLANEILSNPIKVEVTPVATTAEKIEQSVFMVDSKEGKRFLLQHLLQGDEVKMALVFTRTKHGADKICRFLNQVGVTAEAIHGNKSQNNRVRALDNFKNGQTRILVATDIAARGIDIDGVSHVINYELPNIPETYVHRIGRTARAGAEGKSYSFCDSEEREYLRDIEKLIRQKIRVETDNPFAAGVYVPTKPEKVESRASHHGRQGQAQGQRRPQGQRSSSAPRGGERRPSPSDFGRSEPRQERRPQEGARTEQRSERPQQSARPQNSARPQSSSGGRPPRDRPQGDRPQGSRTQGGRPQQGRSQGARSPEGSAQNAGSRGGSNASRHRKGGRSEGSSSKAAPKKEAAAPAASSKPPWWKRIVGAE